MTSQLTQDPNLQRIDIEGIAALESAAQTAIASNEFAMIAEQMEACVAWGAVIYQSFPIHEAHRKDVDSYNRPDLALLALDIVENSSHATLVALRALHGQLNAALDALPAGNP